MASLVYIATLALTAARATTYAQSICVPPQETTSTIGASAGCSWTWPMYYPTVTGPTCMFHTSVVTVIEAGFDCSICSLVNIPMSFPKPTNCDATLIADAPWTVTSMQCAASQTYYALGPSSSPPVSTEGTKGLFKARAEHRQLKLSSTSVSVQSPSPSITGTQSSMLAGQIAVALEVVAQVESGQDPVTLCNNLTEPATPTGSDTGILDSWLIREIVCSLSSVEEGYVLSASDHLADLAAALAIIDVGTEFLNTTSLSTLCSSIDYPSLAVFHIDWQEVETFVCTAAGVLPLYATSSPQPESETSISIMSTSGPPQTLPVDYSEMSFSLTSQSSLPTWLPSNPSSPESSNSAVPTTADPRSSLTSMVSDSARSASQSSSSFPDTPATYPAPTVSIPITTQSNIRSSFTPGMPYLSWSNSSTTLMTMVSSSAYSQIDAIAADYTALEETSALPTPSPPSKSAVADISYLSATTSIVSWYQLC